MMNRIILIGNGFDLAHGLPTSYADFIRSYWSLRLAQLIQNDQMKTDDGLCTYELPDSECRKKLNQVRPFLIDDHFSYISGNYIAEAIKRIKQEYSSKFFEEIDKAVETYNWVDIEAVYYHWLTKIFKQGGCEYTNPNILNDELSSLAEKLSVYLTYIQTDFIKPELKIESVRNAIYEPFRACDISTNERKRFNFFLENRWGNGDYRAEDKCKRLLLKYGLPQEDTGEIAQYVGNSDIDHHIYDVYHDKTHDMHPYFLLPDDIMFLNFNYTTTADLYIPEGSEFKVNHIHGELNNEKNPIIFGYGDELDDDYKEISKLNNNDYLKNIKSIRYLETDNYRKLLSFIDSAPFQIYIMGHSAIRTARYSIRCSNTRIAYRLSHSIT